MIKAAVFHHPAFDLAATSSMESFVWCGACQCTDKSNRGGDGYVCVGEDDEDSAMCDHCRGSCWCDERYWTEPDGEDVFAGATNVFGMKLIDKLTAVPMTSVGDVQSTIK